jgi:hypothetical protein
MGGFLHQVGSTSLLECLLGISFGERSEVIGCHAENARRERKGLNASFYDAYRERTSNLFDLFTPGRRKTLSRQTEMEAGPEMGFAIATNAGRRKKLLQVIWEIGEADVAVCRQAQERNRTVEGDVLAGDISVFKCEQRNAMGVRLLSGRKGDERAAVSDTEYHPTIV